jgi:hypothetical protein
MVAVAFWAHLNKLIWRALADPVGQPVGRLDHRTPIFLNRFLIQPLAFQENPHINVAVSIAIGRQ